MSDHDHAPAGAVERVLGKVVVGTHQAIRAKDENDAQNMPRERELQYQFEIEGEAADKPVWEEFTIEFDYAFFYAPSARESSLEYPHFTYGAHTSPPVGVHATVTEWIRDEENGSIIGAKVAVAAVGTGKFAGVAHLSFQGYAMLIETEP